MAFGEPISDREAANRKLLLIEQLREIEAQLTCRPASLSPTNSVGLYLWKVGRISGTRLLEAHQNSHAISRKTNDEIHPPGNRRVPNRARND